MPPLMVMPMVASIPASPLSEQAAAVTAPPLITSQPLESMPSPSPVSPVTLNVHGTAVDSGDGYIVLIGVDAVIAGGDVDGAAVDGEVQLRVQPLIVGGDVQHTSAGLTPSTFMDILE